MNKKGLSEVVTTVLIILLVLAAVIIVWTVLRPMIEESAQQINTDSLTSSLTIAPNSIQISEDNNLTLKVLRKVGEGNISGVNVILETASGQRKTFKVPGTIKELETKTITIPASTHGITEEITQVLISAIVTNSNGEDVSSSIVSGTNVPKVVPVCGDGTIQSGEDCEGTNLNGKTCQTLGYLTGTLNCTSSCTFDTSQCFDLNNGLIAYYKFDETSYSGTAGEVKDQTGKHNSLANGTVPLVLGLVGNAAKFTSTDGGNTGQGYIIVNNTQNINMATANFSILAWVKLTSIGDNVIIGKAYPNWWRYPDSTLFFWNSPQNIISWGLCGYSGPTSNWTFPMNTWHQVGLTLSYGNNLSTLYIDGNNSATKVMPALDDDPSYVITIGKLTAGFPGYFNGLIDELMIFNKTLTSNEISQIYNSYSS